jgi:hypothetical protein
MLSCLAAKHLRQTGCGEEYNMTFLQSTHRQQKASPQEAHCFRHRNSPKGALHPWHCWRVAKRSPLWRIPDRFKCFCTYGK